MPTRDIKTLLETQRFRVVLARREDPGRPPHEREIIRHPGAVVILPLLDDGRVCLIHNRRISVDRELIELPAGTLEPGEDPRAAAERELLEETGFHAARFTRLHAFFVSPGILDEQIQLFLAEGLTLGAASREPGEEIENLLVPWSEAVQMALDGRIEDAKSLVGLLIYDRIRGGE
jgi:ADP-ribose pyrophosphatase